MIRWERYIKKIFEIEDIFSKNLWDKGDIFKKSLVEVMVTDFEKNNNKNNK